MANSVVICSLDVYSSNVVLNTPRDCAPSRSLPDRIICVSIR